VALNIFGAPKRRSRSTGSKGVDTVLTIAAVGALGVGAYVVLTSGTGFNEARDTLGRGAKNFVDAADSTFDAVAKGYEGLLKGLDVGAKRRDAVGRAFDEGQKRAAARRDAVGEGIGNAACHLQRGFGVLLSPFGVKPLDCKGAGSWVSKKDSRVIALHMLTASPKSYPKITNDVAETLARLGADPDLI
jgi:hypothetical protein